MLRKNRIMKNGMTREMLLYFISQVFINVFVIILWSILRTGLDSIPIDYKSAAFIISLILFPAIFTSVFFGWFREWVRNFWQFVMVISLFAILEVLLWLVTIFILGSYIDDKTLFVFALFFRYGLVPGMISYGTIYGLTTFWKYDFSYFYAFSAIFMCFISMVIYLLLLEGIKILLKRLYLKFYRYEGVE